MTEVRILFTLHCGFNEVTKLEEMSFESGLEPFNAILKQTAKSPRILTTVLMICSRIEYLKDMKSHIIQKYNIRIRYAQSALLRLVLGCLLPTNILAATENL